jgi:hypothetical protein
MKHLFLYIVFTLFSISSGLAQKSGGFKLPPTPFNFKVNLPALFLRNISLQVEFAVHKNLSVCLGGRMMLPYSLNQALGQGANDIENLFITGYAITPEIRFYPGKKQKHPAPHGFYFAPYFRYSNFNISASLPLAPDPNIGFPGSKLDLALTYSGWAGGIMMGSQWVIDHFTIDWWIMGLHFGQGTFAGSTTSADFINYPGINQELKTQIDNALGGLPFDIQSAVSVVNNTANVRVTGLPFGGVRAGLCIGFAF